ncbi:hypothetical protein T4B_4730 [Trichinella pseudospiralis]|uniref:Uncharacterized protein n=1 Tax=Trichinella pseudospiralis TaxID=6337 RepID=A0A0V1HST9_TRIPS|nr:hypothetical protein T4B_4730 [Trichinella pseudospiralis]
MEQRRANFAAWPLEKFDLSTAGAFISSLCFLFLSRCFSHIRFVGKNISSRVGFIFSFLACYSTFSAHINQLCSLSPKQLDVVDKLRVTKEPRNEVDGRTSELIFQFDEQIFALWPQFYSIDQALFLHRKTGCFFFVFKKLVYLYDECDHSARVHILSAPFAKIDKSNQANYSLNFSIIFDSSQKKFKKYKLILCKAFFFKNKWTISVERFVEFLEKKAIFRTE